MSTQVLHKNKILATLIPLLLIVHLAFVGVLLGGHPISAINGVWAGSGTEQSPYLIADLDDLIKLSNNVNSGISYADTYFKLTADITMSRESGVATNKIEPIGKETAPFSGTFDGDGHAIRNLTITGSTISVQPTSCIGLFGCSR